MIQYNYEIFLRHAYNEWDAPSMSDKHYGYCLFVGDWDYVPCFYYDFYDDNNDKWMAVSERYYSCFGSVSNCKIMLGRWPVKPNSQFATLVHKTINYEKNPNLGDWRRNILLIAGGGLGESGFDSHLFSSRHYVTDIGYDTSIVRWMILRDSKKFADSIQKFINEGTLLSIYWDHGGPEAWWHNYDTIYVKQLTNSNKLPVVLSNACLTAMFQWDHPASAPAPFYPSTSFAEHFLFNPNGGSVAFFGATIYADMTNYYDQYLQNLFVNQNWILGKFLFPVLDKAEYCILGDPALDLGDYTAYPDLPDLVVLPVDKGITLLDPYPYPSSGATLPIRAKILNIGHKKATNVEVQFLVRKDAQTYCNDWVTVPEIKSRDSAIVIGHWNTAQSHPGFLGEIGDCDFIVKVDPDNLIPESWEYNDSSSITQNVTLYPNEAGWPIKMNDWSQPVVANIDGQGNVEIIYCSGDSVWIFNYDGSLYPEWPKCFIGANNAVVADINNDFWQEIIAVSLDSIKVFDLWGNVLPGWPVNPDPNIKITGLPVLGRISDGLNGAYEIIVALRDLLQPGVQPGKLMIYSNDGQPNPNSPFYTLENTKDNCFGLCVENVFNGGPNNNDEILLSYVYNALHQYYGKTDIFNINGRIGDLSSGNSNMTPALADLFYDNNGYMDIILGGFDQNIRAYDYQTSTSLWSQPTSGRIESSPVLGDIYTGNQTIENAFGNDIGRIYLKECQNGVNIDQWPYQIIPTCRVVESPAIGYINSDNILDLIVPAWNNYIYAFDQNMYYISPYPLPTQGSCSSPLIGDIDGDYKNEIVVSTSNPTGNYLHLWDCTNSQVIQNSLDWPQFHHDYKHTGLYGWVDDVPGGGLNPTIFSTTTILSIKLKQNRHTRVKIYNSLGHPVKTLLNQHLTKGNYQFEWDGRSDNGVLLPDGMYFVEIKVNNGSKLLPVRISR